MNGTFWFLLIPLICWYVYLVGLTVNSPGYTGSNDHDERIKENYIRNINNRYYVGWILTIYIILLLSYHNLTGSLFPWGEHPWD